VLFLLPFGHDFLLAPQAAAHLSFVRLSQAAPPCNQDEASRRDRRQLARDFSNGHGALFRRRVVHEAARENVQVLAAVRDAFFALCALSIRRSAPKTPLFKNVQLWEHAFLGFHLRDALDER